MSDEKTLSVFNLGDLSKPVNTLVEKISSLVGGCLEPTQIRRVAQAKADASLIEAQTEIEITDLHRRAMKRFVEEEAQKQSNIESITLKAIPDIKDTANPSDIENDWIINFFDKSRIVSDEKMQFLWSKILAGEANHPGSFSKKTVNSLSNIEKSDAEWFISLCRFIVNIEGEDVPLILDVDDEIYRDNTVTFTTLIHLEGIGLLKVDSFSGFTIKSNPPKIPVSYYGNNFEIRSKDRLSIGKVLFTQVGLELSSLCLSKPVEGFLEYAKKEWPKHSGF